MAVSTVDDYLSALEKSKLLGSEQLVEAQRLAGESSDAPALARALARENLVSRWQASTILALGQRAQLRLGKYKLIQRLGKGGMGTVFLAEHVTMNRRVALKVVPRSVAENRASLDRFFAEARAIAALDHPNIVQAYSVDNEMDRYFIVMEFVDGQDLQQLVEAKGPLGFEQAANYIRQSAEGLAHAHVRNLVHCDIKPSNLLVNQQGVIKILDLGLARLNRGNEPRGAAAGEPAFGTVDYMAPEQALEAENFDQRADIYSLGCTLYYLLTGHPPFPEGTLAQRIVKHQTQEPRDILLERADTPPKLVEVCKRMMAKEPEARYQSMQEVSAALAPLVSGSNGSAGGQAVLAVTPLPDGPAAGEDYLSFLATPKANGVKPSASPAAAASGGSGKQRKAARAGRFAAAVGVMRARLAWFNTPKRKLLGAGIGAAVLAIVAGLASLPWLLSHPKPAPQVAQQTKAEAKKPPVEEDVGLPQDKPAETRLGEAKPAASRDSADKHGPAAAEKPKPPATKSPDTPPPKATQPAPQVVQPSPQATQPAAKTDTPPPAKTEVATAAAKPTAVPPPEKKEPPPPPAKPVSLDGLAAAVELPQLGKGAKQAVSLGKLDLDPKLSVDLQLLGGDVVARSPVWGNLKFQLQKEGEGGTAAWSIQMAAKNKDPVNVARIRQEGGEWKIEWSDDARDKATLARYCGLLFSCEKKTHFIALSKPKTVAPLALDVERFKLDRSGYGALRELLRGDSPLPDPSSLRLEILPFDKSIANSDTKIVEGKGHAGKPQHGKAVEPVRGNKAPVKGHVVLTLTKEKTPHLAFDISMDGRVRDIQLDLLACCEISGNEMAFELSSLVKLNNMLTLKETANSNSKVKMPEQQAQALKMAKEQLTALNEFATELSQKGVISFRIYNVVGESDDATQRVVIFESGKEDTAKPGPAKKGVKGNNKKKGGKADPDELPFN